MEIDLTFAEMDKLIQLTLTDKPNDYPIWLVATRVFNVRLLHSFALTKKLLWLAKTNVITLKIQTHAVNAR